MKAIQIFQIIRKWRWKMKLKKWRFFLLAQNISSYIFLWTSLSSNRYSDFSHLSSIKSYSPSKWVHFACFCPFLTIFSLLLRAITFDQSKIWKFWGHLKSAKFKVLEKYHLRYFEQEETIFIFSIFIFHLRFWIIWKIFIALILLLKIIFPTRYYFWLYLFTFKSN